MFRFPPLVISTSASLLSSCHSWRLAVCPVAAFSVNGFSDADPAVSVRGLAAPTVENDRPPDPSVVSA